MNINTDHILNENVCFVWLQVHIQPLCRDVYEETTYWPSISLHFSK